MSYLNKWEFLEEESFQRHFSLDMPASHHSSEYPIPEELDTWMLVENVCYESSRCISQVISRLCSSSYVDQENLSVLDSICLYEDYKNISFGHKTIRQLCEMSLERHQLTNFVVWFVRYLECWNRGQKEVIEKEAAFYDIVQLVQRLWKPISIDLRESSDHSTTLLSSVFILERAKLLYEKREFDSAIQGVSTMLKHFRLEEWMVSDKILSLMSKRNVL